MEDSGVCAAAAPPIAARAAASAMREIIDAPFLGRDLIAENS
jgi:hypothetical protein